MRYANSIFLTLSIINVQNFYKTSAKPAIFELSETDIRKFIFNQIDNYLQTHKF